MEESGVASTRTIGKLVHEGTRNTEIRRVILLHIQDNSVSWQNLSELDGSAFCFAW